jgi:hypothetical protein
MHIIFQFGEFTGDESSFLSDLFVAIVGAFIGTGGAILVYYWQSKDQNEKEAKNRYNIQSDQLKYLYYLLDSVTLATDKMIEVLDEFYKNVNFKPTEIPPLKLVPFYDFNRIVNVINQGEYYHAYKTLVNDENISRIFGISDFLYGSFIDLEQYFKNTSLYDLQRRKDFAESMEQLISIILDNHKTLKDKEGITGKNYNIINNSIFEYHKALDPDPSDFLKLRDDFLTPLIEETVSIKSCDEIYQITMKASQTSKLLTPIILSNLQYADEIKSLANSFLESNGKLKDLTGPLRNFVQLSKVNNEN